MLTMCKEMLTVAEAVPLVDSISNQKSDLRLDALMNVVPEVTRLKMGWKILLTPPTTEVSLVRSKEAKSSP